MAGATAAAAPGYIEVDVGIITAKAYDCYLSRRRCYDSNGTGPAQLASIVWLGYGRFSGAADATCHIKLF